MIGQLLSLIKAVLPFATLVLITCVCGLTAYTAYCNAYVFSYWEKRGVKTPHKAYPLVGSVWGWWGENLQLEGVELKRTYGGFHGVYEGSRPVFIVSDLDAVRDVLVKEFETFPERRKMELATPVMRKFLSLLRGEEWKETRNAFTPAFSSGKIKRMIPLMEACCEDLVARLNKELTGKQSTAIEFRETLRKLGMDAIARCVFAVKLKDVDDANDPFMKNAAELSERSRQNGNSIFFLLFFLMPAKLMTALFRFVPNTIVPQIEFFGRAVQTLLDKHRSGEAIISSQHQPASSDVVGNNFIALMREAQLQEEEAKKGTDRRRYLTDESIIAQSVIFFVGGFENITATLSTACFLLAKYPQVQEKLFQEIRKIEEKANDINKTRRDEDGHYYWTHDMIAELTYVDQVLHETLRLYPFAPWLERVTAKDTTLCGVPLQEGTLVRIPVFTIHHDEDIYPDPEIFDPERFSAENKKERNPYAFLPFGHGPKNCIGLRFAMEDMRVALTYIVKNFSLRLTWENDALQFPRGFGAMMPENVRLQVRKR